MGEEAGGKKKSIENDACFYHSLEDDQLEVIPVYFYNRYTVFWREVNLDQADNLVWPNAIYIV